MRDRVTHRYFDVDYDVVWDTITNDLPTLESAVRSYIDDAAAADQSSAADDAGS